MVAITWARNNTSTRLSTKHLLAVTTTGMPLITLIPQPTHDVSLAVSSIFAPSTGHFRMASTSFSVEIGPIGSSAPVLTIPARKWACGPCLGQLSQVFKPSTVHSTTKYGYSIRTKIPPRPGPLIAKNIYGFRPHLSRV